MEKIEVIMQILNKQLTSNISLYELLFPITVNKSEILPFIESVWSLDIAYNLQRIAERLQIIRDYYNKPLVITSGFRPVAWELGKGRLGGSFHTKGYAADFHVQGVPLSEVYAFVNATFKKGGRAISPKDNFIHLDCRDSFETWSY